MAIINSETVKHKKVSLFQGVNSLDFYYEQCNCLIIKNTGNTDILLSESPNISLTNYEKFIQVGQTIVLVKPNNFSQMFAYVDLGISEMQITTYSVSNVETHDIISKKEQNTICQSGILVENEAEELNFPTGLLIYTLDCPADTKVYQIGSNTTRWTGPFLGYKPLEFKNGARIVSATGGILNIQMGQMGVDL